MSIWDMVHGNREAQNIHYSNFRNRLSNQIENLEVKKNKIIEDKDKVENNYQKYKINLGEQKSIICKLEDRIKKVENELIKKSQYKKMLKIFVPISLAFVIPPIFFSFLLATIIIPIAGSGFVVYYIAKSIKVNKVIKNEESLESLFQQSCCEKGRLYEAERLILGYGIMIEERYYSLQIRDIEDEIYSLKTQISVYDALTETAAEIESPVKPFVIRKKNNHK